MDQNNGYGGTVHYGGYHIRDKVGIVGKIIRYPKPKRKRKRKNSSSFIQLISGVLVHYHCPQSILLFVPFLDSLVTWRIL
jgi:hypothetical protein